jgi:hypothetical protein
MISPDLHFRDDTSDEEVKQTALKRDEEQVKAIVYHLNETMTDPFDIEAHPPCLMNISTCNDGFFSAHLAPNTVEAARCLSNGKLAFFKS